MEFGGGNRFQVVHNAGDVVGGEMVSEQAGLTRIVFLESEIAEGVCSQNVNL